MKHRFKQAVDDANGELTDAVRDMVRLSNRIQSASGLSAADVSDAEAHGIVYEAGEFIIEPRHSHIDGRWAYVLMVTPKSVGSGVGWSNVEHNEFPDGWRYFPKGTGTVVAPTNAISDEIVAVVKELK